MSYIQGFVQPVPAGSKAAYLELAERAWALFQEFGAVGMAECWGDHVPEGTVTSFPMAVKRQDDEVVVFSWITWPDKATHDKGMAALEQDPRWTEMMSAPMPLDGQRVIYGTFEVAFQRGRT